MAIDMDVMLAKIKDRQWALADIDWDAPGAEMITDEQRPKLKAFMADLCWIENIGARGFAGQAKIRRLLIDFVGHNATPGLIIGAIQGAPLINRIRNEIVEMGMEPERLYKA